MFNPTSWQLTEGAHVYSFYPAASRLRRWQTICRIPSWREQWIVPLYVQPGFPWRPCVVDWAPEQRN